MSVVDVVKWDAAPGIFAWKFPSQELSSWTQLIVSESQEAFLLKEGNMIGPFGAGKHTLSTDNYPVLTPLLKTITGRSPFTAEVWFIQKTFKLDLKWGTSAPIQLEDPKYHIMLPVRAFGRYGITIANPSKFLLKLVGTLSVFDERSITEYLRGIVVTRCKNLISEYLVTKQVSILQISANLNEISSALESQITSEVAEYGIKLVNFNVNGISTDDNDPAVKKLREALASKAEMDIVGFNYQQKRTFDTMEAAAANTGNGSVMNAGLGLGLGVGLGAPMGGVAGAMAQNMNIETPSVCSKCGAKISQTSKFCPQCGNNISAETITCASCGKVSPKGTNFCPDCGKKL